MKKSFILDTNVILSAGTGGGSKILNGFLGGKDANDIIIPGTVLQELDKHKTAPGETGYNARDFIRVVDHLRDEAERKGNSDLVKGVKLARGHILIEPDGVKQENLPIGFSLNVPDNRIISTCIDLAHRHPRKHYVFVTNDVSCRLNADICFRYANVHIGIEAYKNDHLSKSTVDEYRGYKIIEDADPELISELYEAESTEQPWIPFENKENLYDEEFLVLKSGSQSALAIYEEGKLKLIRESDLNHVSGIKKLLNIQQKMAMYALLAPADEIPLVCLTGAAGSGKTFLPVAAGLDQTYTKKKNRRYERMIISRSNALNRQEDLGFLPGSVEDKMEPLILPVKDSIESLLRNKKDGESADKDEIEQQVNDIFNTAVDVLPMLYIRGRNLTSRFFLIDEAQNLNEQQAFDVLSRCGKGTKIVMVGDIGQIDNPLLDKYNSGLSIVWNKMRGKGVAMVAFDQQDVVRSDLVRYAIERMKK
ncbi:MAG: PhoH family protein [Lactimicrobium sp.]|uniref:PhoH family protein n=1 Tax=Lactimicrobium sp. TaxID=2563780 RepID=UPI002F35E911